MVIWKHANAIHKSCCSLKGFFILNTFLRKISKGVRRRTWCQREEDIRTLIIPDPSTRRFTDDTEGNWPYITTKDPQISFCLAYKQEKDKLVTSYYGNCLNTHDSDCAWGSSNWLPTCLGSKISCSHLGKDDRKRNQDDSESIKNMQLLIVWFPLSSSTTGPSMNGLSHTYWEPFLFPLLWKEGFP